MSSTTLISLRLADDILAAVDQVAADEDRSRAQVISISLRDHLLEGRKGPVTPRAKPSPKVPRGTLKTDALATTGGKVTITQVEAPPNRIMDILTKIPQVSTAANLDQRYVRPEHDPKTCRIYKCGLCAAAKGEK